MSSVLQQDSPQTALSHPVDHVEDMVIAQDWAYERTNKNELIGEVTGHCCDYRLYFVWQPSLKALYFSCLLDLEVSSAKRSAIHALLALINEKLWVGHFDLSSEEDVLIYRHTLLLGDSGQARPDPVEDLVDIAMSECERFYPAFQFVLWSDKSPQEALDCALIDTVGSA